MIELKCYKCDGEGTTPSQKFIKWYEPTEERMEEFNNTYPSISCPRCCGEKSILYHDKEDYFNKLAERWEEETCHHSCIQLNHPCYISMKQMGEEMIPFLLKRMQREKTWLFSLLAEVTNKTECTTDKSMAGMLGDLTDSWIDWGIKKKFIQRQNMILYSDGACSGNPGPGGFGTIVDFGSEKVTYNGGYRLTTNNRMELLGIIYPLEQIGGASDVTIYTDSKYVVDAINKNWLRGWIKKGWKTASKTDVKNQDLWKRFISLLERNKVSINWIKGHNEHPENEECDKIAVAARLGKTLYTDFKYEEQQKNG